MVALAGFQPMRPCSSAVFFEARSDDLEMPALVEETIDDISVLVEDKVERRAIHVRRHRFCVCQSVVIDEVFSVSLFEFFAHILVGSMGVLLCVDGVFAGYLI